MKEVREIQHFCFCNERMGEDNIVVSVMKGWGKIVQRVCDTWES